MQTCSRLLGAIMIHLIGAIFLDKLGADITSMQLLHSPWALNCLIYCGAQTAIRIARDRKSQQKFPEWEEETDEIGEADTWGAQKDVGNSTDEERTRMDQLGYPEGATPNRKQAALIG